MNNNAQNVTFTMKFDPADLKTLAQQISAIFGASPAGGGGGKPAPAGSGASAPGAMGAAKGVGMLGMAAAMFAASASLEVIKKGIEFIVRNSSVANTYLGAMGKVVGAAIDLLLIPFTPIFNLILVGLAKLVEWLARDDVQKFLSKIMGVISNIANWLYQKLQEYLPKIIAEISKLVVKMIELVEKVMKFFEKNNVVDRAKDAVKDTQEFVNKSPIVNNKITKGILNGIIENNPITGQAKSILDMIKGGNVLDALLPNPTAGLPIENPLKTITGGAFKLGVDAWRMSGIEPYLPVWLQDNQTYENRSSVIVQQQPQVNITIHEATDGKKMAEIAQEQWNKAGQRVTLR